MKNTVLALLLAAAICATAACAQGPPPKPGGPGCCVAMAVMPPRADMADGLAKVLGLTADQTATLKTILTSSDATLPPLVKAAADASKALRDALFAATFDVANVEALSEAALKAEADVVTASIGVWAQIRSSLNLTEDQLAKLQAGPGRGGPPPGPPPNCGKGGGGSSGQPRGR